MLRQNIKKIIEQIREMYFDINQYNTFHIEEGEKIGFLVKKEGITIYDFEFEICEELRVIYFKDNIKEMKSEVKKYILFFYIKDELERRGFTGFLTTNDGNKKFFKNLKIKLQPIDSYAEKILTTIKKMVKEDERIFINAKKGILELINEKGEEKEIKINYEDAGKQNVIIIENNEKVYLNDEVWRKEKLNDIEKEEIEKAIGEKIGNDEFVINNKRIPIMKIEKNKKKKIIIGKEVIEKEELNEIIKKIKTMRISFYL